MKEPSLSAPLSSATEISRRNLVLLCAGLFALVCWTFLPAIRNGFINLDDSSYLTENDRVWNGLTLENIYWAFTSTEQAGFWHPLTWLSHMLDCQIFGWNAGGHHFTSIVFHALSTVLVFLVFRLMTRALWPSLALAVLFGLHPLRVESVVWAAERKDVLSTLFWLLTLWAYARYAVTDAKSATETTAPTQTMFPASRFYRLALVFFALGLMAKPMLVTLPCVLLLLDYWPLRRATGSLREILSQRTLLKNLGLEKVPFFALTAAASAMTLFTQTGASATAVGLPLIARLENALVSYARYLGKLFYPTELAAFYPHPGRWETGAVLVSLVLLVLISLAAVVSQRKRPYVLVGWLWYLGTLVPAIGLVQVGEQAMADRFSYIPSLGILIILCWAAWDLIQQQRAAKVAVGGLCVATSVIFVILTRQQIPYWKDSETLFRHTLAVTTNNHVAHFCLGVALSQQERIEEAIREYQKALEIRPNYALAHNNLGLIATRRGQLEEAIFHFEKAAASRPDVALYHKNLGLALGTSGRNQKAIQRFQMAVELDPEDAVARNLLGVALLNAGLLKEAVPQLRQAVSRQPDSAEFRFNLGNALARQGRDLEAIGQFREALNLQPAMNSARYNLANALSRLGRIEDAIKEFHEALKHAPDSPEAHNNLGVALANQGHLESAIHQFQEALRLNPHYPEAQKNLETIRKMNAGSAE